MRLMCVENGDRNWMMGKLTGNPFIQGKAFFCHASLSVQIRVQIQSPYLINFNHPYSMHSLSLAQSLFCMTRQLGCRHKPGGSDAQSSGVWIEIGVPTKVCHKVFVSVWCIQHSTFFNHPFLCQNFARILRSPYPTDLAE